MPFTSCQALFTACGKPVPVPAHHLVTSIVALASGQTPVVVQVHGSRGLDLIQLVIGALVTLGLVLALTGGWLLLRHRINNGGRHK